MLSQVMSFCEAKWDEEIEYSRGKNTIKLAWFVLYSFNFIVFEATLAVKHGLVKAVADWPYSSFTVL